MLAFRCCFTNRARHTMLQNLTWFNFDIQKQKWQDQYRGVYYCRNCFKTAWFRIMELRIEWCSLNQQFILRDLLILALTIVDNRRSNDHLNSAKILSQFTCSPGIFPASSSGTCLAASSEVCAATSSMMWSMISLEICMIFSSGVRLASFRDVCLISSSDIRCTSSSLGSRLADPRSALGSSFVWSSSSFASSMMQFSSPWDTLSSSASSSSSSSLSSSSFVALVESSSWKGR